MLWQEIQNQGINLMVHTKMLFEQQNFSWLAFSRSTPGHRRRHPRTRTRWLEPKCQYDLGIYGDQQNHVERFMTQPWYLHLSTWSPEVLNRTSTEQCDQEHVPYLTMSDYALRRSDCLTISDHYWDNCPTCHYRAPMALHTSCPFSWSQKSY